MIEKGNLPDLTDAARRAGSIVNDQINSIVEVVERQADEIRRDAEHDARETRRDAADSARRVLERIDSLERPLGELVQTLRLEMDRVQRELDGPVEADAAAITAATGPAEPRAVEAVFDTTAEAEDEEGGEDGAGAPPAEPLREAGTTGGKASPTRAEAGASPEEAGGIPEEPATIPEEPVTTTDEDPPAPTPEDPPDSAPEDARPTGKRKRSSRRPAVREPAGQNAAEAASESLPDEEEPAEEQAEQSEVAEVSTPDPETERSGSRFSLRRWGNRGKAAFVTSQGHCAVCQKTFMAGSEENLRLSGWKVSGDVGVCPECQADGWQLPEGARLPFRRGGS